MERSHHFITGINMPMCTCIMYLPVMSSFLWPYCGCTHDSPPLSLVISLCWDEGTFHPTVMTLSVSILHIPIFRFCITYFKFPFYIRHMRQIKFHSWPIHSRHRRKTSSATSPPAPLFFFRRPAREECCWNLSKRCQPWQHFQMTIDFCATSIRRAFRSWDYSHLKQALKIKYISE